jgi:fatty acid synthase
MYVDQTVDNEVPLQPMRLLFRVCGDKASVTQPVVQLPSACGSGTDLEDGFKAGPILFMLPGLEGMASILEPLARHLNYQTVCLQLGYSHLGQTVQDMAQTLLPVQITP